VMTVALILPRNFKTSKRSRELLSAPSRVWTRPARRKRSGQISGHRLEQNEQSLVAATQEKITLNCWHTMLSSGKGHRGHVVQVEGFLR
jgi:hypothetical protein